ncbi:MAG TPA: class I SAM-dependent methyltransferase [Thermoanaerobaculia bacterium]|nr:class I SAM-dependent methyltransferase [Thermoanaerobaculia bacterium]HXK66954.1 class I SAM-dependent methyltransferase [Thermoanaerobaculia bacterium]
MTQRRNFDNAAPDWDSKTRRIELARAVAEGIRRQIEIKPSWELMDYGCGTGLLSFEMAPYVATVTGVDSSEGMLNVMSGKIHPDDHDRIHVWKLDFEHDPIPDKRFHIIVSSMTLHHIPDPIRLLSRMSALLHPGGSLAMADLDREDGDFHEDSTGVFHHGFSGDEFREILTRAGYTDVDVRFVHTTRKVTSSGETKDFRILLATGRRPGD